jgi:hypothetical protein
MYRLREFLPWRSVTVYTELSGAEASIALERSIGQGTFKRLRSSSKSATFRFRRNASLGNSGRPVIDIEVHDCSHMSGGACIVARMRPICTTIVFGIGWIIGATLPVVLVVGKATTRWPGAMVFLGACLLSIGLSAVLATAVTALVGGMFAVEVRRTEILLREILPPGTPPPHTEGPYR